MKEVLKNLTNCVEQYGIMNEPGRECEKGEFEYGLRIIFNSV
jgi:hypothetical protein